MRLVLRNTLTIGFALALLGVIADAIVGNRNISAVVETNREVAKSRDVQTALEQLLSTVKDAETGQRGYIITGRSKFLEPYREAVADVEKRLDRVRTVTADQSNHQARVAYVVRLTHAKLKELADTIAAYDDDPARGPDVAIEMVNQGGGNQDMEKLRKEIRDIQSDEREQLKRRESEAADSLYRATLMNLIAGIAGVLLVVVAFGLFRRDLKAREASATDLRRANDELEARVARRTDALQKTADELSVEVEQRRRAEDLLRQSQDELERRVSERTAELRTANARLAEADRHKDEFLAMLAHELRNPLAPIRNAVSLMRRRPGDDPVVGEMSTMLDRQVGHLAQLVDDLMDVARITSGKIELRLSPTDLSAVVRRTADAVGPLLAERHHTFAVDTPMEPAWVSGDPVRLEQILTNLVQNAAKYTPPGGRVRLALAVLGAEGGPGEAQLTVADSGMGIRPEMLPRIFDMFQQGDRPQGGGGKMIEGLGIGLTLVRNLVALHGGTVEARSPGLGKGSEFVIRLPLTSPGVTRAPTAGRSGQRPRRVLVVDDNKDAATSLAAVLRHEGHDVRLAYDGPEALAAVASDRPQVVLLDIGMPGMDGYEVARRLRKTPDFDATAIIALTGFGSAEDHRLSREAGFDRHLTKPVDPEALLDVLARV
jgi:signal transduction histidine kinase